MPDTTPLGFDNLFNKFFEDKNKNGIPDIFEHTNPDGQTFSVHSSSKIIINGKTYESIDAVPDEEKEKMANVLKQFKNFNTFDSIFNSTTTSTSSTAKPKETKVAFSTIAEPGKKISSGKILNIVLLILLAIAAWLIWGKK
jgi:DNA phosphorothioation-dependent restriction protein DptG